LDGNLGALPGFAGDGADDDGVVVDLRDFRLEQVRNQLRGGAGHDDLRALGGAVDLEKDDADALTDAELLQARLFAFGATGFGLAEIVDDVLAFNALDGCVEDFFFAVRIFIEDGIALGFTHLLKDDLLGKLRGDAAEGAGVAIEANLAAHFNLGRQFDGVRQRDLVERVFYLFISCHDGLIDVSRNLAGLFVQLSAHVFLGLVIFARSEGNGFLDGSDDDAGVDAFFLA